ncbi:unnamed protein product [Closterium sp. NIES-65]|nr:unnamed protein product [Closterium sp. NIES-65]
MFQGLLFHEHRLTNPDVTFPFLTLLISGAVGLTNPDVTFPFLTLLISGGHNLLLLSHGVGQYTQLGTTLDDAMGEAFDKTARLLGLDLSGPGGGGAAVEALAKEGNREKFKFTVLLARVKSCDFPVSALSNPTAAQTIPIAEATPEDWQLRADIAASFQEVAVLHLQSRVQRAIQVARESAPAIDTLVMAGGVASNQVVRTRIAAICEQAGVRLVCPPPRLCTDNGVMVAWAGAVSGTCGEGVFDTSLSIRFFATLSPFFPCIFHASSGGGHQVELRPRWTLADPPSSPSHSILLPFFCPPLPFLAMPLPLIDQHQILSTEGPQAMALFLSGMGPSIGANPMHCRQSCHVALSAPWTEDEVRKAIRELAPRKSPGADGLPKELFDHNWGLLGPVLMDLVRRFMGGEALPHTVSTAVTILLHKKGDKGDLGNYRPITLLSTVYKIIAKVMAGRLKVVLHEVISEDQYGFLPGRQLADAVSVVADAIEAGANGKEDWYLMMIDFQKAFDSISGDYLFDTLRKLGLPEVFVSWTEGLHKDAGTCVHINGWTGDRVAVEKGVRQGCPLAPYLFLCAVEPLCQEINRKKLGIGKRGVGTLAYLGYADDTSLLLRGAEQLEAAVDVLTVFGRESGLVVNEGKTVVFPLGKNRGKPPPHNLRYKWADKEEPE